VQVYAWCMEDYLDPCDREV